MHSLINYNLALPDRLSSGNFTVFFLFFITLAWLYSGI